MGSFYSTYFLMFKKILITIFVIFIINISTLYIDEVIVLLHDGEFNNRNEIYNI